MLFSLQKPPGRPHLLNEVEVLVDMWMNGTEAVKE